MRKLCVSFLTLMLVLSLIGCGSNKNTNSTNSVGTNGLTTTTVDVETNENTDVLGEGSYELSTDDSSPMVLDELSTINYIYTHLKEAGYPNSLIAALSAEFLYNSNLNPAAAELSYAAPEAYENFMYTTNENIDKSEMLTYYFAYGSYLVNKEILSDATPYISDLYGYPAVGIGLLGWTGNRSCELIDFASEHEKPWYDISAQLDFIVFEIENYYDEIVPSQFEELSYEEAVDMINTYYIGGSANAAADAKACLADVESMLLSIDNSDTTSKSEE